MKARLVIATAISFFILSLISCSKSGSDVSTEAAFDATGIWKGEAKVVDTDLFTKKVSNETVPIEIRLAQTGRNIAGKIIMGDKEIAIERGFVIDRSVSFEAGVLSFDASVGDNGIEGVFKGKFRGDYGVGSMHELNGSFKAGK